MEYDQRWKAEQMVKVTCAIIQNQDLMRKIQKDFQANTPAEMQAHICHQARVYVEKCLEEAGK